MNISPDSMVFLLELEEDEKIFLPSLKKMTVNGKKSQESKDDKCAWLIFPLWVLVNQQRSQMFSKGQEGKSAHYDPVGKQE